MFLCRFPGCGFFAQVEFSSVGGGTPAAPAPAVCPVGVGMEAPKMSVSRNQTFLSPNQLINGDFDPPFSPYLKTGEHRNTWHFLCLGLLLGLLLDEARW